MHAINSACLNAVRTKAKLEDNTTTLRQIQGVGNGNGTETYRKCDLATAASTASSQHLAVPLAVSNASSPSQESKLALAEFADALSSGSCNKCQKK